MKKAIPDFSIRFVDESFAAANAKIQEIQERMVTYFAGRNTDLSAKGIFALKNSFAAIYYLPWQTGMSLRKWGVQFLDITPLTTCVCPPLRLSFLGTVHP